jgi:hypothetical protein
LLGDLLDERVTRMFGSHATDSLPRL